jgi:ketosteroid isomerase-like protein
MKTKFLSTLTLAACALSVSCRRKPNDFDPAAIVAMERANLDRWGKGDPQAYLDAYAPEVTYFDPAIDKRNDGAEAMRKYYAPLAGKIRVDHYDMIDPVVQHYGDVAVLSYNLVSMGKEAGGTGTVVVRWNSTKVYALIEGNWKIVHDHWSYTKPDLKKPLGQ